MGTPTTADAVSWEPTATTSRGRGASSSATTEACSVPILIPGSTTGGNKDLGSPSRPINSVLQLPLVTSSNPVVEALVRSTCAFPVSQKASRSGIISMVVDWSMIPSLASTASW